MFLPGRNAETEKQEKQKIFKKIENWCLEKIPSRLRAEGEADVCVSVQEVQCGDPQCAPIDTAITILFESGGQGIFGLPMEAKEVTLEDLTHVFPTEEVLEKWHRGEEAEWPVNDMSDEPMELRFEIGTRVLCRVGPTDWAPGQVMQQWYREPQWTEGSYAPYKIRLNDGRDIYAPADMDQIIRLDPNAPANQKKSS